MRVPPTCCPLLNQTHAVKGGIPKLNVWCWLEEAPHARENLSNSLAHGSDCFCWLILPVPGILSPLITKCMPTNNSCFYSVEHRAVPFHGTLQQIRNGYNMLQYLKMSQQFSLPNCPSSSGCWSVLHLNLDQVPQADEHRFQLFVMSNYT